MGRMIDWGWCDISAFRVEMLAGIFGMITWKLTQILLLSPWTAYQMWGIELKYDLAEPSLCAFICERIAMLVEFIFIWIPVTLLIVWMIKLTGSYLVLAFLIGTTIVKLIICYIYPLLIKPLTSSTEELPAFADKLRTFIKKEADMAGFNSNVVLLEKSFSTDVHVNASTSLSKIKLGEPLFKGHGQWPAEIMAVLCHELGHYKLNHLFK